MLSNGSLPYREDMPARKVQGKNLRIFVPHNWEFAGAEPLIGRLRREFNVWEISTPDSRSRIMEASLELTKAKVGKKYDAARAALFKLQDLWERLTHLNRMLAANPDSAVLELHCMPKDNHRWDGYVWEDYYFRIRGTWLVMPSDIAHGAYTVPMNDIIEAGHHSSTDAERIVRHFEGLDIGRIAERMDDELGRLKAMAARAALLEIPVRKKRSRLAHGLDLRTDFEIRHLAWQSLPANLNEAEIRKVVDLFGFRNEKFAAK